MIIVRRELEDFLAPEGRRLLYGRRKTGKTFYIRYKLKDHTYFIVKRGGLIYDPENQAEYHFRTFIPLCRHLNKVVIDEFHRAPNELFYAIQAGECPESIVLVTSTLHYHRRFTEALDSPLKGMFLTKQVKLISPLDLIRHPWGRIEPKLIERLIYYQEPVLINRKIREILLYSGDIAKSLIGEVLSEEDYEVTARYHYILEAISMGKNRLTEIASYLYSRHLIPTQSTSHITKYIDIMTSIGLIEKIPVWMRRRTIYRHLSPLTHTAYYLNAKYGIWDYPVAEDFILKAGKEVLPHLIEVFVEKLISTDCGLRPVKIIDPEIDVALLRYKKLALIAEIKWKNKISKQEIEKASRKLTKFTTPLKLIITKNEPRYTSTVPIVTLSSLIEMIKRKPRCLWIKELSQS